MSFGIPKQANRIADCFPMLPKPLAELQLLFILTTNCKIILSWLEDQKTEQLWHGGFLEMLLTSVGWIHWITFCISSNYCSVLPCKAANTTLVPRWLCFTQPVITIWHHKKTTPVKPDATLNKLITLNEKGYFECSRSSLFVTTTHKYPPHYVSNSSFYLHHVLFRKRFPSFPFLSLTKDHLKTKRLKYMKGTCVSLLS